MKVENIKNLYKDEWVLVEVIKESPQNRPLEVKVLAHSKDRGVIYDKLLKIVKRKKHLATLFTGKVLQEDYAAAFHLWKNFNINLKKKA